MDESQHIVKAKHALGAVKKKELSTEERREGAIDLAENLLNEARRILTNTERRIQEELAAMMNDPKGKAFTVSLTDQCFRTQNTQRVADQMLFLIKKFGIPRFASYDKQAQLLAFRFLGKRSAAVAVPFAKSMLRSKSSHVIISGEKRSLLKHIKGRREEGVRVNLNHLGEAILGEEEAKRRFNIYVSDLENPEIEYISVKVSTIYSQLNLLAWEDTLSTLAERLKELLRKANENKYIRFDGTSIPKFVNLDMEEYRDLHLTVDLFKRVLDDPEFYHHSAGIVLQSYLPDSYLIQQELTIWAMQRVMNGGAPIKIRLVKGANLAMEQVDASLHHWPQAPYTTKADVDANFKRMINYAFKPEHARAVRIGIASHNLFDIAYAMLLRVEKNVEEFTEFEMLEGMADHIRKVVQNLSGDMLLYCPIAKREEFKYAIAYLVRRLDENTAPDNFLRYAFELIPGTKEWYQQTSHFSYSCHHAKNVSLFPRRTQNRLLEPQQRANSSPFVNEADTDWTLKSNRKWAESLMQKWKAKGFSQIPLVIGDEDLFTEEKASGHDPSIPEKVLYQYSLSDEKHVDQALSVAKEEEAAWAVMGVEERITLMSGVAQGLRRHRKNLIGAMIADCGKTVPEADVEVSEAIDFVEYYARSLKEWKSHKDLQSTPKGTILVASPWNFPCSIPIGCVAAALTAGNCVIFKPTVEAILVAWHIALIFWEAGISRNVLQFITGTDDKIGKALVQDSRIDLVMLTGATETAKLMHRLRPGIDLIAETGGKNALIVTSLSDRDLAIRDIVHSAFGHAGQKCSACSIAILEQEVYDNPHFRNQLRDAAMSWKVGSAWNLSTKINPLVHPPEEKLLKGLTTLEEGEEWLLEPKQDPENPNLWSPGIKLGVKPGSFTQQTELFGPVLGLMRANNLTHAIELANETRYGLTSGIHSLDEREWEQWMQNIEAGNCYINRSITGAIVQRQPFGGCKESSFGQGLKAGGPNYLIELMRLEQIGSPPDQLKTSQTINLLTRQLEMKGLSSDELNRWRDSVASYAHYWKITFSLDHDPSKLIGQDNILRYVAHKGMVFRIQSDDNILDIMRVIAAALTAQMELEISSSTPCDEEIADVKWVVETEDAFCDRIKHNQIKRLRLVSPPSEQLQKACTDTACNVISKPVLANGRAELLNYLREVSISFDYHRYGNLGTRENETRALLPEPQYTQEQPVVRSWNS